MKYFRETRHGWRSVLPPVNVLGHKSQEMLLNIMIPWSYKFEKHCTHTHLLCSSCSHSLVGLESATHSRRITVRSYAQWQARPSEKYCRLTFLNLAVPKLIGFPFFLSYFMTCPGIMILWKTLWKTLVSVVLSFMYHEWIYFKNRRTIQLRKDAGCDIRKPILDSCLLFAK